MSYTIRTVDSRGRYLGPPRRIHIAAPPSEEPPALPPTIDDYPEDGSVADVLEWVGENTDRAKAAIVAEHGRETTRKTLLTKLNERTGGRDALE